MPALSLKPWRHRVNENTRGPLLLVPESRVLVGHEIGKGGGGRLLEADDNDLLERVFAEGAALLLVTQAETEAA